MRTRQAKSSVGSIQLQWVKRPALDAIVTDLVSSTLSSIELNLQCTIPISIGPRCGYDHSEHTLEVPTDAFVERGRKLSLAKPAQFRKLLVQLIAVWLWNNKLSRQDRAAYASILAELPVKGEGKPDRLDKPLFRKNALQDFAIAFEQYCNGRLEKQRRSWIHAVLFAKQKPFDPPTLPSQMGGPRLPPPERKMPVPSSPFTPEVS